MSVSEYKTMRERVRESIRDTYGLLWSDNALDELINEAQREYALYANTLTSEVTIVTNGKAVYTAPVDFLEPVKVYNENGCEIPIVSWKYLNTLYPDFRKATGDYLKAVCFDFDGLRKYRIFPNLPSGRSIGKIVYRRIPSKDQYETRNMDAIEAHCLFQMYLLTGRTTTINYWKNFIAAVNREARSNQTMRNRRTNRRGVFF